MANRTTNHICPHTYDNLDAYAPIKPKNFVPNFTCLTNFFSFSIFIIFMLLIFTFLLGGTAHAADDQLTIEIWQDNALKESYYQPFYQEFPLIPVKLLSQVTNIPIGWQSTKYGSALVWGRQEIAAVLMPNRGEVIAISGGDTDTPTFYQYNTTEQPKIIDNQFFVPIEALPFLGIDYKLLPIENKIQLFLPQDPYNTIDPDLIWQLTKDRVTTLLTPPPPKITTTLLASATTSYNAKEGNRTHNLFLATGSIRATVIKPGKSFSFNQTVGERTPAKGYKKAIVFSAQEKVMDYGGGICQVSTTLYQAAAKAKLKITERHSHSLPVSYATKGKDATVAWRSKDFKFVNNTKSNIYIVGKMQKGKLTIEIWQGDIPKELPPVVSGAL